MIMRIWHGVTEAPRSEAFTNYLMETGVPWYRSLNGNRGVFVLRRMKERRSEFLLLSLWESESSIRAFAGPDIDQAVYNFARDKEFLIELESEVAHYEVLAAMSSGEPGQSPEGQS